jgi:hypothetical protein
MLRYRRLADPEFRQMTAAIAPGRDIALALRQESRDPATDGVAKDIERVHGDVMKEMVI